MTWENFKKNFRRFTRKKDIALIEHAFDFASEAHKSQKRLTGDQYINHPIAVSLKICELKNGFRRQWRQRFFMMFRKKATPLPS